MLPFFRSGAEVRATLSDDELAAISDLDAYAYRSRLVVRMITEPDRDKRRQMIAEINALAEECRAEPTVARRIL